MLRMAPTAIVTLGILSALVHSSADAAHQYPAVVATIENVESSGGIVVDSNSSKIYDARFSLISILSSDENRKTGEIVIDGAAMDLALDARNHRLFVASYVEPAVTIIDTSTDEIAGTISLGVPAQAVAVDSDTGSLYVGTANGIHVLNPLDGTETASIPTDGEVRDIVVDQPTGRVFIGVATPLGAMLAIVDQQTNAIVKSASFPIGPSALALDSEANRLYALNIVGYSSLSVLDASSLTILKSITDFKLHDPWTQPAGIAVNPTTHRVYVSLGKSGPGEVMVYDTALQSTIGTVDVGNLPESLAVSQKLDRVYVANVNSPFVSVIGDGPPPGPASPTPASVGPSALPPSGGYPIAGGAPRAALPLGTGLLLAGALCLWGLRRNSCV